MNTPFKMKNSALAKFAQTAGSPVKQDEVKEKPESKEKYSKDNPHPMAGSFNDKKTKVIDFMGNWKRVNPRK